MSKGSPDNKARHGRSQKYSGKAVFHRESLPGATPGRMICPGAGQGRRPNRPEDGFGGRSPPAPAAPGRPAAAPAPRPAGAPAPRAAAPPPHPPAGGGGPPPPPPRAPGPRGRPAALSPPLRNMGRGVTGTGKRYRRRGSGGGVPGGRPPCRGSRRRCAGR